MPHTSYSLQKIGLVFRNFVLILIIIQDYCDFCNIEVRTEHEPVAVQCISIYAAVVVLASYE